MGGRELTEQDMLETPMGLLLWFVNKIVSIFHGF